MPHGLLLCATQKKIKETASARTSVRTPAFGRPRLLVCCAARLPALSRTCPTAPPRRSVGTTLARLTSHTHVGTSCGCGTAPLAPASLVYLQHVQHPDLLLQHLDETHVTYVRNSRNTCNIRLKHLKKQLKTLEDLCKHTQHPDKTLCNICA